MQSRWRGGEMRGCSDKPSGVQRKAGRNRGMCCRYLPVHQQYYNQTLFPITGVEELNAS